MKLIFISKKGKEVFTINGVRILAENYEHALELYEKIKDI
jgi:hypothetical protein